MVRRISCAVCAWRETCGKRFSASDDLALQCPDFTFDVRLKETEDGAEDNRAKRREAPSEERS